MKTIIYKASLIFICLSALIIKSKAQELNCTVNVLTPTIQATNKEVFKNMEIQVREFLNGRHWTNDNFSPAERIECNIVINISSINGNDYSGTIQVASGRPVFATNYNSPL